MDINYVEVSANDPRSKASTKILRKDLGESAWRGAVGALRNAVKRGLPALAGLKTGGGTAYSRYDEWLQASVAGVVSALNDCHTWCKLIGGPLPVDGGILGLKDLIDNVFTDLILLALKRDRGDFGDTVTDWHAEKLAHAVNDKELDLLFDTEQLGNILQTYQDACLAGLLFPLLERCFKWVVVLEIHKSTPSEDGSSNLMAPPAVVGKLFDLHFFLSESDSKAKATEKLAASIQRSIGVESEAVIDRLKVCLNEHFGEPMSLHTCSFVVEAHPDALSARVSEYVQGVSGLVSLGRSLDEGSWKRIIHEVRDEFGVLRASVSDPRRLLGVAVRVGPARPELQTGVEFADDEVDAHALQIQVDHAILPMDQDELDKCNQRYLRNPLMPLLFELTMQGGEDCTDSLEKFGKAVYFWSEAEIRRLNSRRADSPWKRGDAFLCYAIVLEVLFGSSTDVTETVSSRAATVLAASTDERERVRKNVRDLYDKRSKYVHEGAALVSCSDIEDLRETVRFSLGYFIDWLVTDLASALRQANGGKDWERLRQLLAEPADVLNPSLAIKRSINMKNLQRRILSGQKFGEHCDHMGSFESE